MHFDISDQFIKREADVLIGTQMIAKGLGPAAGHAGRRRQRRYWLGAARLSRW